MNVLRRLWAFFVVDMVELGRDRTALFFILVLPVAFILVSGLLSGGAQSSRVTLGVVDADGTGASSRLVAGLETAPTLEVQEAGDPEVLQRRVAQGEYAAGLVVPSGFGAASEAGTSISVPLYQGGAANTQVARAAVEQVLQTEGLLAVATRFAVEAGAPAHEAAGRAEALAGPIGATVTADVESVSGASLYGSGFTGASFTMVILFLTITALTSAGTIPERRRWGVVRRSLVTPASTAELVGGFTVARWLLIVATGLALVVVTTVLFRVDWGDLVAVTVVVGMYALVGTGLMAVFGTLLRTPEQAGAVGPWVGIVMGMLGGCMWPLAIVPPPMRAFGHLFPTAWGVDALRMIVVEGAGLPDVWLQLLVLAGFAAAFGAFGILRFRRSMAK